MTRSVPLSAGGRHLQSKAGCDFLPSATVVRLVARSVGEATSGVSVGALATSASAWRDVYVVPNWLLARDPHLRSCQVCAMTIAPRLHGMTPDLIQDCLAIAGRAGTAVHAGLTVRWQPMSTYTALDDCRARARPGVA